MNLFASAFSDPIMQSMIFGPLMGVIFGLLLSGFTSAPTQNVLVTVERTREIYFERVIEHRSSGSGTSNEDGARILFVLCGVVIFILWKYAQYAQQIHAYTAGALLTVLAFAITVAIASFAKGHFNSYDWSLYILSPLVLLLFCMYLLTLAHNTFDPQITERALGSNLIQFYTKDLTGFGRNFVFAHLVGFVLLCIVIAFSALALLHYLSLMNQRSAGPLHGMWSLIVRVTLFFSRPLWLSLVFILAVGSFVAFSPNMLATWIT
ncbi:MAG: hypothetical protein PHI97_22495 [Desulfobulbus sp.]|nr:hypothetical protein [Desulfobulbus sp.]